MPPKPIIPTREIFRDAAAQNQAAFLRGFTAPDTSTAGAITSGINQGIDSANKLTGFLNQFSPEARERKQNELELQRQSVQANKLSIEAGQRKARVAAATETGDILAENAENARKELNEKIKREELVAYQTTMDRLNREDAFNNPTKYTEIMNTPAGRLARANDKETFAQYDSSIDLKTGQPVGTTAQQFSTPTPLTTLQQRDLEIKERTLDFKEDKLQADIQAKNTKAGASPAEAAPLSNLDRIRQQLGVATPQQAVTPTQAVQAVSTTPESNTPLPTTATGGQSPVTPAAIPATQRATQPSSSTAPTPTNTGAPITGAPITAPQQSAPAQQPVPAATTPSGPVQSSTDIVNQLLRPESESTALQREIVNAQKLGLTGSASVTAAKEALKARKTVGDKTSKQLTKAIKATDDLIQTVEQPLDTLSKLPDPLLGSGQTIKRFISDKVLANLGDDEAQAIKNAKKQLEGGDVLKKLEVIAEAGGQRVADSEKEGAAITSLSFSEDLSLEQLQDRLEYFKAKATKLKELERIRTAAANNGLDPDAAERLAQQTFYKGEGATVIPDQDGNYVPKTDRASVDDFIAKELFGLPIPSDTQNQVQGFTDRAAPIDPVTGEFPQVSEIDSPPKTPIQLASEIAPLVSTGNLQGEVNPAAIPDTVRNGPTRELVLGIMSAESNFQNNAQSPANAQGLMQLVPATGRELHEKLNLPGEYDPFNSKQNILLGTTYIKELLGRYDGDTRIALTAYNAGLGNVDKALKDAKRAGFDDPTYEELQFYLPKYIREEETFAYVDRIMGGRPTGTPVEGVNTPVPSEDPSSVEPKLAPTEEGTSVLSSIASTFTQLVPEAQAQELVNNPTSPVAIASSVLSPDPERPPVDETGNFISGTQAAVVGLADNLAIPGFIDDVGVGLRMAVLGEDAQTARQNVDRIQNRLQETHPNLYTAGEVTGTVGSVLATGGVAGIARGGTAAAGQLAARQGLGAAVRTGAAAGRAVAPTTVRGLAGVGAVEGAARGLGDSNIFEEGSSVSSATTNTLAGAVTGTASSLVLSGAGKAFVTVGKAVLPKSFVNRATSIIKGTKQSQDFSPAERVVLDKLKDVPEDKLATIADDLAKSGADTGLVDVIRTRNLDSLLDKTSKSAGGSTPLKEAADERLSTQGKRLLTIADEFSENVTAQEAVDDVLTGLAVERDRVIQSRRERGNRLFTQAREEVGTTPSGNNVFESKGVLDLITKNPEIKKAVAQAREEIPTLQERLPRDFDTVQRAGEILAEKAAGAGGSVKGKAGFFAIEARKKLLAAIDEESPTFAQAMRAYKADSELIDEFNKGTFKNLSKFIDEPTANNRLAVIDRVFKMGPDQIDELKEIVGDQALKNIVRGDILRSLEANFRGGGTSGKNVVKKILSDREDTLTKILGKEEFDSVSSKFLAEGEKFLTDSRITKVGSDTAGRLEEDSIVKTAANKIGPILQDLAQGRPPVGSTLRAFNVNSAVEAEREAYKELSEILVTDKAAGEATINKIIEEVSVLNSDNPARQRILTSLNNILNTQAARDPAATVQIATPGL